MLKVISLGGSLIIPDEVDYHFLSGFKKVILDYVKMGNKVIIVCGGGSICRKYYAAAQKISKLSKTDLDWLGVMATRFNAELVRVIFGQHAFRKVGYIAAQKYSFPKIMIIGGDKPGGSSDLDAVLLAKANNADCVINLTDVDHVYDKNPKKYKNAKPYKYLTWTQYKKIIGGKWIPGMHLPFDPIASQKAQRYGIKVIIANGKNLQNLKKGIHDERDFKGTMIR